MSFLSEAVIVADSWPGHSPSNLPSVGHQDDASEAAPPEAGHDGADASSETASWLRSGMAEQLMTSEAHHLDVTSDALDFEHLESFNLLCAGESGLGKSTFLRNLFSHLDPTKQHVLRRRVATAREALEEREDAVARNEQERRICDDQRSVELIKLKRALVAERAEALDELTAAIRELDAHRLSVLRLRAEVACLDASLADARAGRDAEADHDAAEGLGEEVTRPRAALELERAPHTRVHVHPTHVYMGTPHTCALPCAATHGHGRVYVSARARARLPCLQVTRLLAVQTAVHKSLSAELRRSNLDRDEAAEAHPQQTTQVEARLIAGLPLLDSHGRNAREGLDVTLIDTPGYGDVVVDTPNNSSADKVVGEVGPLSYHPLPLNRPIFPCIGGGRDRPAHRPSPVEGARHAAAHLARRREEALERAGANPNPHPNPNPTEKKHWNELVHPADSCTCTCACACAWHCCRCTCASSSWRRTA